MSCTDDATAAKPFLSLALCIGILDHCILPEMTPSLISSRSFGLTQKQLISKPCSPAEYICFVRLACNKKTCAECALQLQVNLYTHTLHTHTHTHTLHTHTHNCRSTCQRFCMPFSSLHLFPTLANYSPPPYLVHRLANFLNSIGDLAVLAVLWRDVERGQIEGMAVTDAGGPERDTTVDTQRINAHYGARTRWTDSE